MVRGNAVWLLGVLSVLLALLTGCGSEQPSVNVLDTGAAAPRVHGLPAALHIAATGHPAVPKLDNPSLRAAWVSAEQRGADASYAFSDASAASDGVRAANSRHGFSIQHRDGTLSVGLGRMVALARAAAPGTPASTVDLTLTHWGTQDQLSTVPKPSHMRTDANRLDIERGSGLTEWYINGRLGIEQGFTLRTPPPHRVGAEELVIELAVGGQLRPVLAAGNREVALLGPAGQVVARYGELLVRDATGRVLPSRLEAFEHAVRIVAKAGDAVYPVDVDPLIWLEEAKLLGSGRFDRVNQLGYSVATSGTIALLGAPYDDDKGSKAGSVYVYLQSAEGHWVDQQKLTASDAKPNQNFGSSLALIGDLALVGAPGNSTDFGAVYVFARSGASWTEQQKFSASDGHAGDNFGYSVSLDGDTAVVGATALPGSASSGATYVFTRTGTTWTEQQKLIGADTQAEDGFGGAVSVSAETVVVGSRYQDSAYVFVRSGASWSQQQKLTPADGATSFGHTLSLDGDTAAIGASSSVYVFVRSGTVWVEEQKLLGTRTNLTGAVALSGDQLLAGGRSRHAYLYTRAGTTWTMQAEWGFHWLLSDVEAVALAGDTAFLGMPKSNADGTYNGLGVACSVSSAVSVPYWSAFLALACTSLHARDIAENDKFGTAVSAGSDTVLVGAPGRESAYVFSLSGAAWNMQQELTANDRVPRDYFGGSVALSGDTALVGAYGRESNSGVAYVFVRSGTVWSQQKKLAPQFQRDNEKFGYSVAISEDTALIGGPLSTNASWVYVFVRAGTTWSRQTIISGNFVGDLIGRSLALSGNTALVGGGVNGAYVFERSGTTWSLQQQLTTTSTSHVALSGDTALVGDGSGVSVFQRSGGVWALQQLLSAGSVSVSGNTAIIGHPLNDDAGADAGSAQIFARSGSVWTEQQNLVAASPRSSALFGSAVSIFGATAVVGAPGDATLGVDAGAAYAYRLHGQYATGEACPLGNISCASEICTDGVCCATLCAGPCQTCASTPGTCTAVTSEDDPDTCTDARTCSASGTCGLKLGEACSAPADCASGFCTDGLCCDAACDGDCDVCDTTPGQCTVLPQSDPGTQPTCAPYLCDGANGSCPGGCTSDDSCVANAYCAADGTCRARKSNGTSCALDVGEDCLQSGCRACISDFCVDGVCCNTACEATCDACAQYLGAPADGTCGPANAGYVGDPGCQPYLCDGSSVTCAIHCTTDEQCAPSYYCASGGSCQPRKAQGVACNSRAGGECLVDECRICSSGQCVDGFCCDTPCDAPCEACSVAAGSSANGTCGSVASGSPGNPSCAPFLCDGTSSTCGTGCSSDSGCAANAWCDGSLCQADRSDASACSAPTQCASNYCVDGVCCNGLCTGQCEACDLAGAEGICTPVVGAPHGSREACTTGSATEPCSAAICNGDLRTSCAGFAGSDVECRTASCTEGVATLPGACNGTGLCPDAITVTCTPYVCAGETCGTSCSGPADCAPEFRCNTAAGTCIANDAPECAPDGITVLHPDGTERNCSPYRCNGNCLTECNTTTDCAPGFVCDPATYDCVSAEDHGVQQDAGCGCRVPGRGSGGNGGGLRFVLLVGLAALIAWRNKRWSQFVDHLDASGESKQ